MAIEKFFVNNNPQIVAELLTEYGVPKYFTEVTQNGDMVTCTIEDGKTIGVNLEMNQIHINGGGHSRRDYILDRLKYIYVCQNAICISYVEDIFSIVITKDNEEKTACIWIDGLTGNNMESGRAVFTYNAASTVIMQSSQAYKKHNLTSMCPIVIGDTDNYTPNVYAVVYSQISGNYTIQIGGVNYFTNGIWCIKDSSS